MSIERPWPPRVSQEFWGVNFCPVPTPRDWVPPVRAHAPHGPCGRQCLCSWGFCRAAWTPGGGCSTPAPEALWAEEPGRLGLRPPEEMGRYTGAQGLPLPGTITGLRQAYELSPLLWPPGLLDPTLQGLKAELWPQDSRAFLFGLELRQLPPVQCPDSRCCPGSSLPGGF